jgi:hypothetical protein
MLALNGTLTARTYIRNYYNRNFNIGVVSTVNTVLKGTIFSLIE